MALSFMLGSSPNLKVRSFIILIISKKFCSTWLSEFEQGLLSKSLQSGTGKASRSRVKMMPIGTPRVPYRNREEGTWQWVDIWNALRVIFIGQNIDEEFSNQILATMLYLDTLDDSRRIYMYLNGPGGDLTPSLAIYDTMKSLKSPVGTHCVGLSYNLEGFLLAAGEKGQRFAMPLSRIALQSPAGSARGQADDIQNEAKELSRIRDYLFNEHRPACGKDLQRLEPSEKGSTQKKLWSMDLSIRLLDHRASKQTLLAKTKPQVSASLLCFFLNTFCNVLQYLML